MRAFFRRSVAWSVCAAFLLLGGAARAATVVQTAYAYTAYSETTLDPTFSSAVTSGNTVLVAVIGLFGTTITSATFDGNAMTEDLKTNTDTVAFYRLSNITTGGTVAAITKTNGSAVAWAIEVSGLDNTGQPDETNAWAATTEGFGTSHTEAVTPAEANTFGFALMFSDTGSITWTASGSAVLDQSADVDQVGIIYEDGLSITSDTIAWTTSGSGGFSVASVVYGPSAGGGGGATIPITLQNLQKGYGPQRSQQLGGLMQ